VGYREFAAQPPAAHAGPTYGDKGHPAEFHPRSSKALREAYFGDRPVAHLLVAERGNEIVGMAQWRLVHDMFWGCSVRKPSGST
jgi:hypothetical protein